MSLRFLLDTSALIAPYRREPGWKRVQEIFEESGAEVLVASVSLTELARRLRELGADAEAARRTVEGYKGLFEEVVAIDAEIALLAFDIGCATSPRLPLVDSLIAGAASVRGACLVHRDAHMTTIPEESVVQHDLSRD